MLKQTLRGPITTMERVQVSAPMGNKLISCHIQAIKKVIKIIEFFVDLHIPVNL